MASAMDWSKAFALQAQADFNTFGQLQMLPIPECHKLQFLQMACEKLAKAHLCANKSDPSSLQSRHADIAKTLPVVLRQYCAAVKFDGESVHAVLKHAKHLAQEIEMLAPAVRRGGQRPDNCEYPWEDQKRLIQIPCTWKFAASQLLTERGGRTVLKLILGSISQLLS